jgi:hypothetical protein
LPRAIRRASPHSGATGQPGGVIGVNRRYPMRHSTSNGFGVVVTFTAWRGRVRRVARRGAAPGAVHRVIYEHMVADTEAQVRRLLDHAGVPFEEGCLAFYRNRRAVRTASSEQVRQPIFTDGVDHWRQFEPWLGPLRAALGTVESAYPEVPAELVD